MAPTRRPTPASRALEAARRSARLTQQQVAQALGVQPRTVSRWEIGETHPKPAQWSRLAAFFARYVPAAAVHLADAAGVPSPIAPPPPVDYQAIQSAIYRAADQLDVAPRRVRAALREILTSVADARGTLDDLLKLAREDESPIEDDTLPRR